MDSTRYTLTFMVNNEITCILENLPAHEVYSHGVPFEASANIEGNRWRSLTRNELRAKLIEMEEFETLLIAYQEPPLNPEIDTETIYLSKNYSV